MSSKSKTYTNGPVTIKWESELCIHSGNCVKGLPDVFNPNKRPWIDIEAAETDNLIEQVKKCPSGALSYFMNGASSSDATESTPTQVEVLSAGPLLVHGPMQIKNTDGQIEEKSKVTAFCRCGASSNKPYCDGSHKKIEFTDH